MNRQDDSSTAVPVNRECAVPIWWERYFDVWAAEFRGWAKKQHRIEIREPICDGFEHQIGAAMYCLMLRDHSPWGYIVGDGPDGHAVGKYGGREIWWPRYRNSNGELDASQLIAAQGHPYGERRVWQFDRQVAEIYMVGIALDSKHDVLPALIESVRPTAICRMAPGTALKEIQVNFSTLAGTAEITIPIGGGGGILPPGCGSLRPGERVALRLSRYTQNIARLFAILDARSIAELKR